MNNYKGIGYLRAKLNTVRKRVLTRYEYYENKHIRWTPEIAIPQRVKKLFEAHLGWCSKAVDQMADRLVVNGFANDNFNMQSIFDMNNADILFDSAILGALISACDFIYIEPNPNGGIPRMQVIDGSNATGIIDPVTNLLIEGYAVLERDVETHSPTVEAYFTAGQTDYYFHGTNTIESVPNVAEFPLLVPIIYKPDSIRNFGHSRISRACMNYQDCAEDILTRVNVLSEVASFPQKYVLGLSDTAEGIDSLKATFSSMLRFDKDEDGQHPQVGQFQQMTMAPHIEAFRMYASNFSGETGLTLDDLGFVSDNPSSAESIKASHESLRVATAKAQKNFSTAFVNVGYLASCVRDSMKYRRDEVYQTKVKWKPIVEPDASTLSVIGDGAIKINQAIPGFFTAETLADLTGIEMAAQSSAENLDDFIRSLTDAE